MKLFWFSDEDGHFWQIFAARSVEAAWQLFTTDYVKDNRYNDKVKDKSADDVQNMLKEKYELNAITEITDAEGEVATIFPLECNFYIKKATGSDEISSLTDY